MSYRPDLHRHSSFGLGDDLAINTNDDDASRSVDIWPV